jgi:hypothetical protein
MVLMLEVNTVIIKNVKPVILVHWTVLKYYYTTNCPYNEHVKRYSGITLAKSLGERNVHSSHVSIRL